MLWIAPFSHRLALCFALCGIYSVIFSFFFCSWYFTHKELVITRSQSLNDVVSYQFRTQKSWGLVAFTVWFEQKQVDLWKKLQLEIMSVMTVVALKRTRLVPVYTHRTRKLPENIQDGLVLLTFTIGEWCTCKFNWVHCTHTDSTSLYWWFCYKISILMLFKKSN